MWVGTSDVGDVLILVERFGRWTLLPVSAPYEAAGSWLVTGTTNTDSGAVDGEMVLFLASGTSRVGYSGEVRPGESIELVFDEYVGSVRATPAPEPPLAASEITGTWIGGASGSASLQIAADGQATFADGSGCVFPGFLGLDAAEGVGAFQAHVTCSTIAGLPARGTAAYLSGTDDRILVTLSWQALVFPVAITGYRAFTLRRPEPVPARLRPRLVYLWSSEDEPAVPAVLLPSGDP